MAALVLLEPSPSPSPRNVVDDDEEEDQDHNHDHHEDQEQSFRINSLFRSISLKEPSFSHLPISPSRFSTSSVAYPPCHLNHSAPSSPQIFLHNNKHHHHHNHHSSSHRCVSSMLKKDGRILSVAVSNGLVYTGSEANCVRVWKLPDFTECGKLKSKVGGVCALAVANDRVFAAHVDCKIRVWRRTWDGGATAHVRIANVPKFSSSVLSYIAGKDKKMAKHLAPITSLAANVSEDLLYSASADKTVKVWRISDLKCIETIQAHSDPVNAVAVSDDGVLYTASDDATVRVWRRNFCSGDRPHSLTVTLPAKCSPVKTLALSGDGAVLYGGCTDGYIHFWLKGRFSGQMQYGGELLGHSHAVMCLATVGRFVVSGSADLTARVWERESEVGHVCAAVLQGHRGPVRCVGALGESGEDGGCTVCTGSLDGILKVWRVSSSSTKDSGCSTATTNTAQAGPDNFQL